MAENSEDNVGTGDSFEALLRRAARVSQVSARTTFATGTKLSGGRFEIVRQIGVGGMGVVYEAFDAGRQAKVALKTLSRLEAGNVYRLKNEFRALADLSHPNLVRLQELFADEGQWFFTMDLIDGVRFDTWVRPDGVLDEARLRSALPELVSAVGAIHDAGKLHRDLKPSNVLVTREGRVVVLDFGLAVDPELGGIGQTVADDVVSGTPAYMAPEQAAGRPATQASDYYAVGVMLFEALTGKLPFEGRAGEMLAAKQTRDPPRARELQPTVLEDLDRLCSALLAREPSGRINGPELRAQLGERTLLPSAPNPSRSSSAPETLALLGRDAELRALREAFSASCDGDKPVIVLLAGESGIGKSSLCETFLSELRADGRAVVFASRCFERESVPFKAFDLLIDELSRYLRKLGDDAKSLLPRDAFALRRIFPVLGRIAAIAEAPSREVPDANELRRRAFVALGELLGRIRDRRPLVLHLDDLQWSDADSTLLLMHLVRQADAPRLLLIASHRSEQMEAHPCLMPLYETLPIDIRLDVRQLRLGPLSRAAARALVSAQLDSASPQLLDDAEGNPFLLGELVRHAATHRGAPAAELSLRYLLVARATALPEVERRLLEVLAVAARPVALALAAEAAGTTDASRTTFEALRTERLARATGDGTLIECFHDKVREALLGALTPESLHGHHQALAQALSSRADTDPEQLAGHLLGAGELELAARQFVRAADGAMAELGFDRAARLYQRALVHGRFEPPEVHRLSILRADALAQAGRGVMAAEVYLQARDAASEDEAADLTRKAGEQYLHGSQVDRGIELLREGLRHHGVTIPRTTAGSFAALAWELARLRLRGLDFEPRSAPADVVKRLDAMQSASLALSFVEYTTPAPLALRALTLALAHGSVSHVAFGFAQAVYFAGPLRLEPAQVREMGQRALAQGEQSEDPTVLFWVEYALGWWAYVIGRDLPGGLRHLDRAVDHSLQHHMPLVSYARPAIEWNRLNIQAMLGELSAVGREVPAQLDEGWTRNNLVVVALLAGTCELVLARVGLGDDRGAAHDLERARKAWSASRFTIQEHHMLAGECLLRVATGDVRAAWAAADQWWRGIVASPLSRAKVFANAAATARGRLAALLASRATGKVERATFERELQKMVAATQGRTGLSAELALLRGRHDEAVALLRDAVGRLDYIPLYQELTRRRLGVVLGGEEGKALVAQADAFFRKGGVVVDLPNFANAAMPGVELK